MITNSRRRPPRLHVALALVAIALAAPPVRAAHRSSPLISLDPAADTLDVYAFVSPDRPDSLTVIGTWQGFEAKRSGPMLYGFDPTVRYDLNIDPIGDGVAHLSYQFTFDTDILDANTYQYARGPIALLGDPNLNVRQTYRVQEVVNGSPTDLALGVRVSPPNVGPRSMPGFAALFASAVHNVATFEGPIALFAGQTDDPAFGDLGPLYDLPAGPGAKKLKLADGSAGFNVRTIAIQLPLARLLAGAAGNTVLGVWAASSRQSQRTFSLGAVIDSGPYVQVARTGMPLFHDVVLPLSLKDALNGIEPLFDFSVYMSIALFQQAVLTSEAATTMAARYGVPVPAAARNDLFDVLFQGIQLAAPLTAVTPLGKTLLPAGVALNRPTSVGRVPAEMLRVNVDPQYRPGTPGSVCAPKPDHKRGLLGGDLCGFPNGRRLADDASDIMLRILAGGLFTALTGDTGFVFDAKALGPVGDKTVKNDVAFLPSFPYVAPPHASYGGK